MPGFDFGLFDADNHYYEPEDCFTRHIEPRLRAKAVHLERDKTGPSRLLVGDKPFTFLRGEGFPGVSRTTVKPGRLRDMLRLMGQPDFRESEVVEETQPAYVNRDARLAWMKDHGVEAAFMFPTLAVCLEHFMKDDPEQLYANVHAFNLWIDEEWGFDRGQIYAPPLLSLRDLEAAVAELDFVLARGARAIALRPGPAYGRSPADPYFDPFWARVNEARVPVLFHISESGYNEMMSVHWGEEANPSSHRQSAFQWTNFYGDRPIMDTISALIFHNLFGRYPEVRVVSVENGSHWVSYLMKAMDKMGGMGRNGPWIGGRIREKPSLILRRHVFVMPHHEEDIVELVRAIGPSQVLFGSDFPHPEGIAEPGDFAATMTPFPPDQVRMIMRENALGLVGAAASASG